MSSWDTQQFPRFSFPEVYFVFLKLPGFFVFFAKIEGADSRWGAFGSKPRSWCELVRTAWLVLSGARLRARLTTRPALPRGSRCPRCPRTGGSWKEMLEIFTVTCYV